MYKMILSAPTYFSNLPLQSQVGIINLSYGEMLRLDKIANKRTMF